MGGGGKKFDICIFFFVKCQKLPTSFMDGPVGICTGYFFRILQKYDFNCTIKLSIFASMHRPLDQRHTVLKNFKYVTNDTIALDSFD